MVKKDTKSTRPKCVSFPKLPPLSRFLPGLLSIPQSHIFSHIFLSKGEKSAVTDKVLVLRTSDKDRRSYNGFQWPESGPVEALDWDPDPRCGGGLHGSLWGEGRGELLDWEDDATWQVVEVDAEDIIDLGGHVKFPRGTVVYSGDRQGATEMILAHPGGQGRAVMGAMVTTCGRGPVKVGWGGVVLAGLKGEAEVIGSGEAFVGPDGVAKVEHGNATAGSHGKAIVSNYGQATVGYGGEARAENGTAVAGPLGRAQTNHGISVVTGNSGVAVAGDWGIAKTDSSGDSTAGVGGYAETGTYGTASVGDRGRAVARFGGTAQSGDLGTSIVGDWGTAITGKGGTAIAGKGGTAIAGDEGNAQAGKSGIVRVGNRGCALVGDKGEVVVGELSTAQAGVGGLVKAGEGSRITLEWEDKKGIRRLVTGYIGEDGLLPNETYFLDEKGSFTIGTSHVI